MKEKDGVMYELNGRERKKLKEMFDFEKSGAIFPDRLMTKDLKLHDNFMEELYDKYENVMETPKIEISIKRIGLSDPPYLIISE